MELKNLLALCIIVILCIVGITSAVTQKIYVDTVYNKTNIINVTNITALGVMTQAGYRVLDTRDNTSIGVTFVTKSELTARSYKNGTEINQSIKDLNASLPATITEAVAGRDLYNGTQANESAAALILSANNSMWSSVVALDTATNTSMLSYITSLIANYITSALANTYLLSNITGVNNSNVIYTDERDQIINSSPKDWTDLQNYPAACPANTYISQLNDSVTCSGVVDIYAFNSGDNLTGNYNLTGNISQNTDFYHCFGPACVSYIYYNGSALIIKVS